MVRSCIWGLVASLLAGGLLLLGAATAEAEDGPVLAGTWTVSMKAADPKPEFKGKDKMTLSFGEGCVSGSACSFERQAADGEPTKTALASGGGTFSWRQKQALTCSAEDGSNFVAHGADYVADAKLTPTEFKERGGVRYVTAMSGVLNETARVNGAGRAVRCTASNGGYSISQRSVLTARRMPLASPSVATSGASLAVDEALMQTTGSMPAFELPQSRRQGVSALAVAEERRSSVPGSLTVPVDAVHNLGARLPKDLLLVALIGLLMIFPAQIFNSTYEENHERIDARLARWRLRKRPGEAGVVSRPRRLLIFFLCVAVGTMLGGLLDPNFGPNPASYALLVGVFLSVCVVVAAAALVGRTFRSVTHHAPDWYLRAIPSALLIAVVCVAVSRLSHFQPGYLYGILGGAVFAGALDRRSEGRSETATFGALLVLSLVAWLAFGAISTAVVEESVSFWALGADAFLGSLFIGGIEGLLFGMIPLRFLPGYRIKNLSWLLWAALTALVLYIFVHVLLLPEAGYLGRSTVASVNLTVALLVAFAVASGLFWLWFRLRPDGEPSAPRPPGALTGSLAETGVS